MQIDRYYNDFLVLGRTGEDCRGPYLGENIILTENTPSVMLGAGCWVSLTLSNPPILSLSIHHPLSSVDLNVLANTIEKNLRNVLELRESDLQIAHVGKSDAHG